MADHQLRTVGRAAELDLGWGIAGYPGCTGGGLREELAGGRDRIHPPAILQGRLGHGGGSTHSRPHRGIERQVYRCPLVFDTAAAQSGREPDRDQSGGSVGTNDLAPSELERDDHGDLYSWIMASM